MALSDRNIVITPNIGAASDPKIVFSGADSSTAAQNITLTAYPTNGGTLSFDGSTGQLFSVTNSMSGTIFSVNDVSGIPSIEVLDTGLVKIAQYSGNLLVGSGIDSGIAKVQITGNQTVSGKTIYGPNTTWGAYLQVGGNSREYVDNGTYASVAASDGNLHLDASSSHGLYLNYYDGSTIYFGNGGNGTVGSITSAGAMSLNSTITASNFSGSHSGTSSGTNTGDQTLPTTLPASDVYAWAKTATKPSYNFSEISSSTISATSGTFTTGLVITSADIRSNASSNWTGDPGAQGKIQYHSNRWYIVADESSDRIVQFRRNGSDVSHIDNSGVYQGASTSCSGNAATASKTSSNSGYTRVGTGMAPFYNWGGSNSNVAPDAGSYTTGIDVGSHPNDQAYGFQIASNMWHVGLWTRSYDSGFTAWARILDTTTYNSYAPTLTGTGASGTWGINITGSAATATDSTKVAKAGDTMTGALNISVAPNGRSLSLGGDQTDRVYNDSARASLVINATDYPHFYINATTQNGNVNHGAVFSMTGNLTAGGYRRWGMGIANTDPDCFSWGYADNQTNPHYGVGGTFGYTGTPNIRMWLNTGGSLMTTGDMRAPIFYDSNDTTYYGDFASTSWLRHLSVGDINATNDGGWNARLNLTGSSHARLDVKSNSDGIITTMYSHAGQGVGKVGTYSNHPLVLMAQGAAEGGSVYSGSLRSPIFYDSDNTAYYGDFAGTSITNRMGANYFQFNGAVSSDNTFGLYFDSGLSTAYAIYRQSGAWTHPYPDLRIAFHTGIQIGANASYQGVRFYTDFDMSSQVMSVNNGSDPLGGGNVYVNGSLQAGGSLRAPIFYDSDNTGYYLDPASTSVLNRISTVRTDNWLYIDNNYGHSVVGVYASTIFQGVFAMGDAYKLTAGGGINNLYGMTWSYPSAGGIAGNLSSHGLIVAINGGFGSCMSYNVTASGNVTAYSDERLKRNWEPLCDNFVEKLADVKVGTYERIDQAIVQVGVSAQSLEKVIPEAVSTATDDMQTKHVSYGNAALASAVMLAKELVEMKKIIKQMQEEIAELKRGA